MGQFVELLSANLSIYQYPIRNCYTVSSSVTESVLLYADDACVYLRTRFIKINRFAEAPYDVLYISYIVLHITDELRYPLFSFGYIHVQRNESFQMTYDNTLSAFYWPITFLKVRDPKKRAKMAYL